MTTPTFQLPGYRVHETIGRGGFGVVHAAVREADGRPVAIKVLHRVLDEVEAARFSAEIQVMGTLAWHPAIVMIVDAGDVGGQPYIVMEHLAGGSLGDRLRSAGSLSADAVTNAGIHAAMGLQVAHNAGLLHRDIKPDNLLVTAEGTVKVSDFGVTLAAGAAGRRRGTTGTVAFAAPELLAGAGATIATDIYALGATLFALLTGEPAHHRETDESPAAMILRAHREPVPDLVAAGYPDSLARAIHRAMARDPGQRPARAEDVARELAAAREALGLAPIPVVGAGRVASGPRPAAAAAVGLPDQPPAEARRRAQRLQRVLGGVGAAAAALIAVTFVATSFVGGGDVDGSSFDVGAGDEVLEESPVAEPPPPLVGGPAAAPDIPPPPTPAPLPPTDPLEFTDPLSPLDFVEPVAAVGGADGLVIVATSGDLVVVDPARMMSFAVGLPGLVNVAVVGDAVLGTTHSGPPLLIRPATLEGLEFADIVELDAPELAAAGGGEIAAAMGRFWVATPTGLVAVDPSGQVSATIDLPGVAHVAAAPLPEGERPVVWAASADAVVAIDAVDGTEIQRTPVEGPLVEVAVDRTSRALLLDPDGAVLQVGTDGTMQQRRTAALRDIAAPREGPPLVLTADGVGVLGDDDVVTIVSTDSFASLAQLAGQVFGVTSDGRSVRILR